MLFSTVSLKLWSLTHLCVKGILLNFSSKIQQTFDRELEDKAHILILAVFFGQSLFLKVGIILLIRCIKLSMFILYADETSLWNIFGEISVKQGFIQTLVYSRFFPKIQFLYCLLSSVAPRGGSMVDTDGKTFGI